MGHRYTYTTEDEISFIHKLKDEKTNHGRFKSRLGKLLNYYVVLFNKRKNWGDIDKLKSFTYLYEEIKNECKLYKKLN